MAAPDLFSALIGGTPTDPDQQAALAAALRGQSLVGLLGSASGDSVLAPIGNRLTQSATQQAEDLGQQRMAQARQTSEDTFRQAQMANMTAEQRQQQAALAETVRQHNLENQQKQWEYGIGPGGGTDPQFQQIVDAIGSYQMAPLNTLSTRNPRNLNIMQAVLQQYPDFDTTKYANKLSTVKAFGGGGKQGQLLRSADVGIQHLGVLDQAVTALNNGQYPIFNSIVNTAKQQLGLSTAPTDFAAVKPIVSDEINKFIIGAGGGVTDREIAQKAVDAAQTPQALRSVISHWTSLMGGQINGLKQEYEANTGLQDFNSKLSAPTQAALGLSNPSQGWIVRQVK